MAPNTAQDWLALASERAADAEAMLSSRENPFGPVYMVGYAIECSLKAYLQKNGRKFPRSGSAGHDLKRLWQACGFSFSDLRDSKGHKTFFIDSWNTALRYEGVPPKDFSSSELVTGGKALVGWIQKQIR